MYMPCLNVWGQQRLRKGIGNLAAGIAGLCEPLPHPSPELGAKNLNPFPGQEQSRGKRFLRKLSTGLQYNKDYGGVEKQHSENKWERKLLTS